ncbi:Uncharacterised protein [Helicobacter fennelliae]|uniref:Uncharacterized protein n=1 Tax=Helicobacter fennelliae TaxID=215 RepID=A0A2X3DIX0_9HELI|nr:hypothetical protein [Helicobacter fennelliae]SQB99409.1 Uncharacterised protein [Helicobacter fennelliae]
MTLLIENASSELKKALQAMVKLDNAKIHTIKDDDTLWTKDDQKAYKKAKKEFERGEAISHKELFEKLKQ